VLEVLAPQGHCHIGHAHGGAGMARIGLLNGIHCECADRIRHILIVDHGSGGEKSDKGRILAGCRFRRPAWQSWPTAVQGLHLLQQLAQTLTMRKILPLKIY